MNLIAEHALLPTGWAREVAIHVGPDGMIASVMADAPPLGDAVRVDGFVVPGMPNVHSHAFQRAMAGFTEARTHPTDSFWTWRAAMYEFAARITPEQMHDVAAWLYIEMLKAGFTSVAEFNYVHRDARGRPYAERGEMAHRLIAAARDAGIATTHLPVLYLYGGFGSKPAEVAQDRFVQTADDFGALVRSLHARYATTQGVRVGAAFHSLRAVDPPAVRATLAMLEDLDGAAPIHIHVAEQAKEVADCIAWSGRRPVEWLLDNAAVDRRWCLVHATHADARELVRLAASGAVAGLCPTTEANLGDGIFPASDYLAGPMPGRFGIGSDSHVSVSVVEELRLLEYAQRLALRRRSALASEAHASPGERLYVEAAAGGAQAVGLPAGCIASGCRADLVALDARHPAFWNKAPQQALDAWIFTGDSRCVRDVMVGGVWRVRDGHHAMEDEAADRFRAAQAALLEP